MTRLERRYRIVLPHDAEDDEIGAAVIEIGWWLWRRRVVLCLGCLKAWSLDRPLVVLAVIDTDTAAECAIVCDACQEATVFSALIPGKSFLPRGLWRDVVRY